MLNETLTSGLAHYRIGPKVRALRLKKKLGLVQLGEHTGLSPAMLSKIERGQLFPTLPTLLRIAMVFNVGLEHFFADPADGRTVTVVRKTDRLRLPDNASGEPPAYFFESLDYPVADRKMEVFYAEFQPRAEASEPHQHQGSELIYVLDGKLVINVRGEDTMLGPGDAMMFDPDLPHTYRAEGRKASSAIVVIAK